MWQWLPCWTMQLQNTPPITESSTGQRGPGTPLMAHLATRPAVVLKGMVSPQVVVTWQAGERGIPKEEAPRIGEGETDLLCSVAQLCLTL